MIASLDATGQAPWERAIALRHLHLSEHRGSATSFDHQDYLRTVSRQTSSSQSTLATRTYDASGMLVASTGTPQGPFGFVGGWGYQGDADSGLKLLGHRYYDPSTGRFLTRDPAKDGRNWYTYCENKPTVSIDPDGFVKIRILFKEVMWGFWHAWVLVTDDKGRTTYFRGDRSRLINPHVVGSDGAWMPGSPDWPVKGQQSDLRGKTVVNNRDPAAPYLAKMRAVERKINAKSPYYFALSGPNSNWTVNQYLRSVGVAIAEKSLPHDCPGWDDRTRP